MMIIFSILLAVALNHQNIGKNPQGISESKPFIDHKYEIDFPSHSKDWEKL